MPRVTDSGSFTFGSQSQSSFFSSAEDCYDFLMHFAFTGGERNNTPAGCVLSSSALLHCTKHAVLQATYREKSNSVCQAAPALLSAAILCAIFRMQFVCRKDVTCHDESWMVGSAMERSTLKCHSLCWSQT